MRLHHDRSPRNATGYSERRERMMDRIIITKPFHGICHMQVCCEKDATDEEILSICNSENPSGTTLGWCSVLRDGNGGQSPLVCADNPDRLHILVGC